MDAAMRALLMPDPADGAERARAERLCRGDAEALVELFDDSGAAAYAWALTVTRSKRKSVRILRQAFLRAAQEPQVFCDRLVSSRGWILLEVYHLAWPAHDGHSGSPRHHLSRY